MEVNRCADDIFSSYFYTLPSVFLHLRAGIICILPPGAHYFQLVYSSWNYRHVASRRSFPSLFPFHAQILRSVSSQTMQAFDVWRGTFHHAASVGILCLCSCCEVVSAEEDMTCACILLVRVPPFSLVKAWDFMLSCHLPFQRQRIRMRGRLCVQLYLVQRDGAIAIRTRKLLGGNREMMARCLYVRCARTAAVATKCGSQHVHEKVPGGLSSRWQV